MALPECGFLSKINLISLMSAFEEKYKSDFYFKGEYHDFWELVYVVSGSAGASADEKIFTLSQGDIIFHKPMEFHRLWAMNGSSPHLFIMSFKLSGESAAQLENSVLHLSYNQQNLIESLISALKTNRLSKSDADLTKKHDNYLENWSPDSPLAQSVKNYAEILFVDIIQNKQTVKKPYDNRGAEIYRRIINVMEENIFEWITIDEIAQKCNFSSAYIKKIFSKYSDCGIHNYFLKLKIKKAISLMESGCSVQQTSDLLSFGSGNYFGIVFKRETGMSPLKYMKSR